MSIEQIGELLTLTISRTEVKMQEILVNGFDRMIQISKKRISDV